MGLEVLGDLLRDWSACALDDSIYVPFGEEPSIGTEARVLASDRTRGRTFEGYTYLLGIEQVRDVVEGLERQLGRPATPVERLRATLHYARYDAFIDPREAVGG